MIVDNIKNAKLYYALHPEFKAAFECLASLTAESETGRYEINGDNCFVNLAEYENKCAAECKYEAHAKYIDIQFMVEGVERVEYSNRDGLLPACDYDEQEDALFLQDGKESLNFFYGQKILLFFSQMMLINRQCV